MGIEQGTQRMKLRQTECYLAYLAESLVVENIWHEGLYRMYHSALSLLLKKDCR